MTTGANATSTNITGFIKSFFLIYGNLAQPRPKGDYKCLTLIQKNAGYMIICQIQTTAARLAIYAEHYIQRRGRCCLKPNRTWTVNYISNLAYNVRRR